MDVLRLTDKRFMIKTSSDGENYLAENGLCMGSMDDVCNRLNELNQMVTEQAIQLGCLQAENKDFRIKIDYHKRMHERFKKDSLSLVEENQVYKQKIKDTLQERYNTFKHDYEMAVKGGMPSSLLYDEMDLSDNARIPRLLFKSRMNCKLGCTFIFDGFLLFFYCF